MKISNPLLSMPTSASHAAVMAAALLESNRARFGTARMDGDNDPPKPDDPPKPGDAPKVNEHGFPDNTPVADMPADQQVSYWKHKARKHEDAGKARGDYDAIKAERDQLKQAGMTADEKAIEEARKAGETAGRADERGKSGKALVQAKLETALNGRIGSGLSDKDKAERLAAIVGPLDHNYFLTSEGGVDADKVSAYASGFGQGGAWPDMGQGHRDDSGPAGKAQAGKSEAERRGYVKST